MDADLQRAAEILSAGRYLTMATCGPAGAWATPLAYSIHEDGGIYYYSGVTTRHSEDIGRDPRVAGAIFNSTLKNADADGVQFEATVETVTNDELEGVMERYFKLQFPDPKDRSMFERPSSFFRDGSGQRFFRLRLTAVFVPDLAVYDAPFDSPQIDRRTPVDLSTLVDQIGAEAARRLKG